MNNLLNYGTKQAGTQLLLGQKSRTPHVSNIVNLLSAIPYKICLEYPVDNYELADRMLSNSVSFVLSLVCLWYAQVSVGHRPDLENVAYSKKVTLSSDYKAASYPGSNAVNGLLSDFAASEKERFPWLRIDLEEKFRIHEIEVFARTDCLACGM